MTETKGIEPNFFTKEELDFFAKWAYQVYQKGNPKHIEAKNILMKSVWARTAYWSDELVRRLRGYETLNPRMWSERGWDDSSGVNKRVSRFKNYTWARIFKSADRGKDIFFTVGVEPDSKSLLYKIDYYATRESKLNSSQKELCDQLIPDNVRRIEIPYSKIPRYDWRMLLDETEAFIRHNETVYDEIIRSVWNENVNVSTLTNRLVKRDIPKEGLKVIPEGKFSFKGHDTDWTKQLQSNTDLGIIGEDLVKKYEQDFLEQKGLLKLSRDVRKVKDGEGYDIFSRHEDGSPKYIEVKSTEGDANVAFPISPTEVKFSELNAKKYYLYRLFKVRKKPKVAEFYAFHGDIREHFLLEGVQFKAYKKSKE